MSAVCTEAEWRPLPDIYIAAVFASSRLVVGRPTCDHAFPAGTVVDTRPSLAAPGYWHKLGTQSARRTLSRTAFWFCQKMLCFSSMVSSVCTGWHALCVRETHTRKYAVLSIACVAEMLLRPHKNIRSTRLPVKQRTAWIRCVVDWEEARRAQSLQSIHPNAKRELTLWSATMAGTKAR